MSVSRSRSHRAERWSAPTIAWACRALAWLPERQWPACVVAFHRVWDGSRDELSYPPAAFAELCRYWRDHFEMLTLDRLLARHRHGDVATHPTLAITFDDGYADNAEVAAPILDRLGLGATFFVTTGYIGTEQRFAWDRGLARPARLMRWEQVRELHRAGFGIGSHTVSHARLSQTPDASLRWELDASRRRLEAEMGEAVLDFAYPFGGPEDCGEAARGAIASAGYRSCFSCHGGLIRTGESAYRLRRVSISPRYHGSPRDWAAQYARLRWQAGRRRAEG